MAMDEFTAEALRRLPLADAVLECWAYVTQEDALTEVYEGSRGRCYEAKLRFSEVVDLVYDTLLEHKASGRTSLSKAREARLVQVSDQALYGKLRRMPVAVSQSFLADMTVRLQGLLGTPVSDQVPASMRKFEIIAIDGKKIKNVAKRLKLAREVKGKLLGGKGLVACSLCDGMVVAMAGHLDGETNDGPLVPPLLEQVRRLRPGPRLFVADSQFCDLTQPRRFAEEGDCFVVRKHPKVQFHADSSEKVRTGRDSRGRKYRDEIGWLGSPKNPTKQIRVRRITVKRSGQEDLVIVTNLLDRERYPADDLLTIYALRWGIETVFQRITEVFALRQLISSTPQGTIFQLAFSLLLYNVLQVVRWHLALAQQLSVEEISTLNVFDDLHQEICLLRKLVPSADLVAHYRGKRSRSQTARRLQTLLGATWNPRWKSRPKRKGKPKPKQKSTNGGHTSVYRVLQQKR